MNLVKSNKKLFYFGKWESESEKILDNGFEFYEEPTKVIRYIIT